MSSQPKSDPTTTYMTAEELLAIRGTPEFDAEYRRQHLALAAHDRLLKSADRWPTDWEALDKVWK